MKALLIKILIASGILNALSLVELEETATTETCSPLADCVGAPVTERVNGFPFSYLSDERYTDGAINKSVEWLDIGSLAANWLFWAAVAFVAFFVLRWVWDKFSRLVFYALIVFLGLAYLGSVGVF